ncbi:hypothetical protein KIN20_037487 [Parelaphostrongylus tenuis]|uniref:Uncharacterized protein n=1 Tax=Parelaphostrongylus tenuis TaxID=148309 RepID=A0AAD5REN8_PARTN|nr:hypothetical protein KIN20_037487 [Parelaphostrongylus tenuis]
MKPRFADGDNTTKHTDLLQHVTTSDNSSGHADKLLQEFVVLELTETPAAQLAKMTGDGAWNEFIRKTFDDNSIFEQIAKKVVLFYPKTSVHKRSSANQCGQNPLKNVLLEEVNPDNISVLGENCDRMLLDKNCCEPELEHFNEDTHVLIEAQSPTYDQCLSLIEQAKKRISDMLTPEYDNQKREQLLQLAILNGTYERRMPLK